ncbi:hypothetical protein ECE50_023355 [Chitinophaga sp. Mgbs1]|uniref:Uncharacterized protein n=1 Tax=Chitinophaga solisilvae TaxID=1233460 RepID=A0A3S1AUG9_9BACT|nr:hypothetical protein [Chitinophaga solisilvae]
MNAQISVKNQSLLTSGLRLSVTAAQEMINTYQQQEPDGLRSFMFSRHLLDQMLEAPQCAGIRIFNAMNEEGEQRLIFTAADASGERIRMIQVKGADGAVNIWDPIFTGNGFCPFDCPKGALELIPGSDSTSSDLNAKTISSQEAQEMILSYQHHEPEGVYAILLGRQIVQSLLNTPGCAGIRVFNAIDQKDEHTFLLAPVNAAGGNLLQFGNPIIAGEVKCPFDCPKFP